MLDALFANFLGLIDSHESWSLYMMCDGPLELRSYLYLLTRRVKSTMFSTLNSYLKTVILANGSSGLHCEHIPSV